MDDPKGGNVIGMTHIGNDLGRSGGNRKFQAMLWVLALFMAFAISTGAMAKTIKIVAFGDSLVAGYGLQEPDSFPAQLQAALTSRGHKVTVVNAGVSGDTTTAGLARFDWAVGQDTDAVILELGANDALRGQSPERAERNLEEILKKLKARNIPVLLTGMRAPTNWGEAYVKQFDAIYPKLAKRYNAILYPFFLEGVALQSELNQADGIHPNRAGIAEIIKRILPNVEQLIARVSARS
ncbi:MAG: arylesterase [Pseudomonadota bacterium]